MHHMTAGTLPAEFKSKTSPFLNCDFLAHIKEPDSNATCCKASHLQDRSWQAREKCTKKGSDRCWNNTHTHTPDAGHASSLRAKLASLQLTGNNLSFSFQLPGQTFKLQLLQREGENVSQHVSIYLLSHLQSSWTSIWLCRHRHG